MKFVIFLTFFSIVIFNITPSRCFAENNLVNTVGFEIELSSNYAEGNPNFAGSEIRDQHLKKLKKAVNIVKKVIGDNRGSNDSIVVRKWEKYPRYDLMEILYTDHLDRLWIFEPEWVNFPRPDGVEIVTPPFTNTKTLNRIYKELLKNNKFGVGRRSSIQVTFNVGHLITNSGNCSKLVDLILYLENNALNIYAVLSPQRYGTIVNRFAVPLAVDHPTLLKKLAELPKRERTFDRVKKIFQSYFEREEEIWLINNPNTANDKAFKYRAFNYKKLFGLGEVEQQPLLEIRIQDATNSKKLKKNINYLIKLINRGSANPVTHFKNPWGRVRTAAEISINSFTRLNKRIFNLSEDTFNRHLEELNVPKFTKSSQIHGEFRLVPRKPEVRSLIESVDLDNVIMIGDQPVTAGFEIEFRHHPEDRLVNNSGKKIRHHYRSFMEKYTEEEITQNIEARSLPTNILSENFENMRIAKRNLIEPRSFHLHLRFSNKIVQKIGTKNFESWISRISDTILGWRLQNRKTFFALNVDTQLRLEPGDIDERGTMRIVSYDIDRTSMVDLEIRGFMTDVDKIEEFTEIIIAGLKNPEHITGMPKYQKMLYQSNFQQALKKFIRTFYNRKLTALEKEKIYSIQWNAICSLLHILPTQWYDSAFFLTSLQQRKVKDATDKFFWWVKTFVLDAPHPVDSPSLNIAFRGQIRKWANEIDYYQLLKDSLLMKKPRNLDHIFSSTFVLRILYKYTPDKVAKILSNCSDDHLEEIIKDRTFTDKELNMLKQVFEIKQKDDLIKLIDKTLKKDFAGCDHIFNLVM